ncbi:MAG: TraR/DksA C4-type zinc finger protein [Chloroflexi bacterium]|nr:TraR/DksA C4-type zinc finger protein [Chloroflexota bacterium]
MPSFQELLQATAARHDHLCPRQVLGVRMGRLASHALRLDLPQTDKRLLTIVETDGCFADGVAVATGCWMGRRTLRIEDYGKVAATFVDTQTGQAARITPRSAARDLAARYAPEASNGWEAYLLGYQRMPDDELLVVQAVQLIASLQSIISTPEARTTCAVCGEEIFNEREVVRGGVVLCKSCAGERYYR